MKKELQGLEEGPKLKTHLDSLRVTFEKVTNWKMPDYNCIYGFW